MIRFINPVNVLLRTINFYRPDLSAAILFYDKTDVSDYFGNDDIYLNAIIDTFNNTGSTVMFSKYDNDPALIIIGTNLTTEQAIDRIIHELAHVISGSRDGHGLLWESAKEELESIQQKTKDVLTNAQYVKVEG